MQGASSVILGRRGASGGHIAVTVTLYYQVIVMTLSFEEMDTLDRGSFDWDSKQDRISTAEA